MKTISNKAPENPAISVLFNEILALIFEVACESFGFPCEIKLSHVSRHWREVALGIPGLWTSIFIKPQKSLHMPSKYLKRSGAMPLNLRVGSHKSFVDERPEVSLDSITQIIRQCAERSHNLRVDARFDLAELAEILKPLAAPPAALCLRTARIDMYCRGMDDEDSNVMKNFTQSRRTMFKSCGPSLTSLTLRGLGIQTLLATPLHHLTSLQLHDPSFVRTSLRSMGIVLGGMEGLKHLTINGDCIGEWTPNVHIILPSLETLQLRMHLILLPDLLDVLSAPVLHSLLLENIYSREIEVFTQKCLSKSEPKFPSLRSLTLIGSHYEWINNSAWTGLFLTFPDITEAAISYQNWRSFLTSLCSPLDAGDKHPWPALDKLLLVYRPDPQSKLYFESLQAALSMRAACGHPIRQLQLSRTIMATVEHGLEKLRALSVVEENNHFSEHDFKFHLSWADKD
ncbi:hypothetical protein FIBSPDRAFT_375691 [Athelia psychrophila]|uniref:F-box domain-containing protein n=1 Tax=Athelia psychrophila TaxID=1759441 RepID=A0A166VZX6_9AGAM|nr:hypothetical protein FIBSPDRAFT_375691 [Fibularhizoctonia sp. CBS 109695]